MRVATAIEVALHAQCGAVNAEYKGRLRSVCANLRRDSGWRAMVLSGEVSAVQIGAMDAAQMLGAAARAAREAAARRAMAEATVTDGVRVERSTAFTCPSCGANVFACDVGEVRFADICEGKGIVHVDVLQGLV